MQRSLSWTGWNRFGGACHGRKMMSNYVCFFLMFHTFKAECDVLEIGKLVLEKISQPVSLKFGIGKSLGIGIGKIWYRIKYRYRYRKYLVLEKYRYRYRLTFWVPSHTAWKADRISENNFFFSFKLVFQTVLSR